VLVVVLVGVKAGVLVEGMIGVLFGLLAEVTSPQKSTELPQ
jgi:type III secretory pathway component EscS